MIEDLHLRRDLLVVLLLASALGNLEGVVNNYTFPFPNGGGTGRGQGHATILSLALVVVNRYVRQVAGELGISLEALRVPNDRAQSLSPGLGQQVKGSAGFLAAEPWVGLIFPIDDGSKVSVDLQLLRERVREEV